MNNQNNGGAAFPLPKGRDGANGEKNGRAKLTYKQVLDIGRLWLSGATAQHLARHYGVHVSTVYRALTRKTWRQ